MPPFLKRSLFIPLLLTYLLLSGQDGDAVDQQLWLEYLVDYQVSKKIDLYADASYRTVLHQDRKNLRGGMARPSVKWAISNTADVRGGMGVFYKQINDTVRTLEIRPWQGVSVNWPAIGGQKFSHFLRLEERFTYSLDPWKQANGFRIRYQLSTRIKFSRVRESRFFYMPLAAEFFFIPGGEKVFELSRNNVRFTLGLGYVFNYRIALEGRFVLQRSRLTSGAFSVTDQIFRIMLKHTLFPVEPEQDEVVH